MKRPVDTVFQDHALFLHMSIRVNVACSLMVRKVPKAARLKRADAPLELVLLGSATDRRPAQLRGTSARGLRPERIQLSVAHDAKVSGVVHEVKYFGSFTRIKMGAP